jgi:hypothetical protein
MRNQTPTLAAWSDKIAPQAIAFGKNFTQYGKIFKANLILSFSGKSSPAKPRAGSVFNSH